MVVEILFTGYIMATVTKTAVERVFIPHRIVTIEPFHILSVEAELENKFLSQIKK
jgi:hypothetical protein